MQYDENGLKCPKTLIFTEIHIQNPLYLLGFKGVIFPIKFGFYGVYSADILIKIVERVKM